MSQIFRSSNPPLHPSKDPKGEQKANRESLRRVRANDLARRNDKETSLTRRKHGSGLMIQPGDINGPTSSNRELEALFFGPSRGGSFLPDPPAVRPRLRRRAHPAEVQMHPSPKHQNSNREISPRFSNHDHSATLDTQNDLRGTKKTAKILRAHPSILLRLNTPPILYFLHLTRSFNRTMLRLNEEKTKGITDPNQCSKRHAQRFDPRGPSASRQGRARGPSTLLTPSIRANRLPAAQRLQRFVHLIAEFLQAKLLAHRVNVEDQHHSHQSAHRHVHARVRDRLGSLDQRRQ